MTPSIIASKVYDDSCEICKHMERHDAAVFQEFPEIVYQKVELNSLIQGPRNDVQEAVYSNLERHCLTPTYEIDLPVYLLLDTKGRYMGHHTGEATIVELRQRVKTILSPE